MKQCWIECLVNISLENGCVLKGTVEQLEEYMSQTEIGTVYAVINYFKWP